MKENTPGKKKTLVFGGTGKTGRRLAERLTAPALHDVASVYVSYYPDLAVPGAVEAVRSFADRAVENGVRRLVLVSGRGEEEVQRAEDVVKEAGAEWTIVRCAWFNQNFSESYLLEPVLGGEVVLPAGNVGEPFVDADDIADVAAAALTEDGHAGEVYELTGPRLLTFAEAIEEIAQASGREIRYVPVSVKQYAAMLAEHEVPAEFVALLTYLFTEVLDGCNAHLTDGVQRALGRAPRDFSEYARDVVAIGVWSG